MPLLKRQAHTGRRLAGTLLAAGRLVRSTPVSHASSWSGVGRCTCRAIAPQERRRIPVHPCVGARAGLTLIEVLIAVTILSVGMTAMLTAASRCVAVMRVARYYQDAQWTLNMGELEHPMLPTDDVSDWDVPGKTYDNGITFSREIEKPEEGIEEGLFIVHSRATWSRRGRESYEEIARYIYAPELAEDEDH